jgi:hypothetical protein
MKIEKPLHYKELRSMTPAEPEKATDTLESVSEPCDIHHIFMPIFLIHNPERMTMCGQDVL